MKSKPQILFKNSKDNNKKSNELTNRCNNTQ